MRTRETGILLPAASGLLLTLSLPPVPIPILAPVALAPLAFHLARLPAGFQGTREAALAGVVTGSLHALLLLHWLPGAARPLMGVLMGSAAALLVWALNGALVGVVTALVHRGAALGRLPLPLGLAAGWVALGWAPTSLPTMGFPWLGPEGALVERPALLGVSELVGSAGVAGVLAFSGGALGCWLAGKQAPGGAGPGWLGGAILLLMASASFGLFQASPADLQPVMESPRLPAQPDPAQGPIRVALLSLEAGPSLLADAPAREAHFPRALDTLMTQLSPGEVEFVLWPESPTGTVAPALERELARRWAQRLQVPIAFGALDPEGATHIPGRPRRNRLFLAWPGEVDATLLREKRRLIPILEPRPRPVEWSGDGAEDGAFFVPLGDAHQPREEAGEGVRMRLQDSHGLTMGGLICFEALFSGEGLRQRREGARILLLPMNEGWLAGRGGGVLESARRQHEAAAVLRAVETRVPVLRSAVGGRAGAWGVDGRALPATHRQVEGMGQVVVADVIPGGTLAPMAARGGAGVAGILALLALGWAAMPARRVDRKGPEVEPLQR